MFNNYKLNKEEIKKLKFILKKVFPDYISNYNKRNRMIRIRKSKFSFGNKIHLLEFLTSLLPNKVNEDFKKNSFGSELINIVSFIFQIKTYNINSNISIIDTIYNKIIDIYFESVISNNIIIIKERKKLNCRKSILRINNSIKNIGKILPIINLDNLVLLKPDIIIV